VEMGGGPTLNLQSEYRNAKKRRFEKNAKKDKTVDKCRSPAVEVPPGGNIKTTRRVMPPRKEKRGRKKWLQTDLLLAMLAGGNSCREKNRKRRYLNADGKKAKKKGYLMIILR